MQQEKQQVKNSVIVRSFNQIQIEPTQINYMYYSQDQNNLYVSREKSSQVYHISYNKEGSLQFTHIARLPSSKYLIKIKDILILFKSFELQVFQFNSWNVHSFTTQLLSIKIDLKNNIIYSFHEQQTIQWSIQQDNFNLSFLSKVKSPFHLNKLNQVEGYGKKIIPFQKTIFTSVDYLQNDFIVVGDDKGAIHIYDFKNLGHLKTFKKHLGPILTIKIHSTNSSIYFTGSDSKVCAVRRVNQDWLASGQVRGQSHDIFALELVNNTLISGGLTTDFCCYPIYETQQMIQTYYNKISYSSKDNVQSVKNLILVNKISSFQIWKINQCDQTLQFLIRYQLPNEKYLIDIKISKKLPDSTYLIIASSQIDTVGWRLSQNQGLAKLFTIKNSYDFIQFIPTKNIFIGLRNTGDIQKVYCKTGKIQQITTCNIQLPTDMKLISDSILIIASNFSHQIKVFDIKKKCLISKKKIDKIYQIICQKNDKQYLIKYVNDQKLYKGNYTNKLIQEQFIYILPESASNIRYGGVIIHKSPKTNNLKRYWYFATQNKILLVNNLNNSNLSSKKKSIRSIYTRQIGTIFKPKTTKTYQIGVIHLNFKRMVNQMEIKPLLAKRIV